MHEHRMCTVHKVSWILVLVGALNWGLVGLFELNIVASLLGGLPLLERIVYVLVGISAILMLTKKQCKACLALNGGQMETKEEEKKEEEPQAAPEASMASMEMPKPEERPETPSEPSGRELPPTEGQE